MLGFKGPAQPSPTLGDALNAGYGYLEVQCHGCDTNQTVALVIVRRPKARPRFREWVRRRGASPPMRVTASWSGHYGPTEYKVVAR
jgi:hypothetical protein